MKHFLLTADLTGIKDLVLKDKDYHYLKNVRRLKIGSRFIGVDKQGAEYNLLVVAESPGELSVHFEKIAAGATAGPEIILYQCLLKGHKLDDLIRQVTEAGIARIIPLVSAHTVVKVAEGSEQHKIQRWRRIAREALQQSGRKTLPEICEPQTLASLNNRAGIKLFLHQTPEDPTASLHKYLEEESDLIHLVVGPEGGLSEAEVGQLLEYDFKPVYLGQNVLRAETAALFALAAVQMILLERKVWRLI